MADDSMEHTLQECPTWRLERDNMIRKIGAGPQLLSVIPIICDSKEAWESSRSFCEIVLLQKENVERLRQQQQQQE